MSLIKKCGPMVLDALIKIKNRSRAEGTKKELRIIRIYRRGIDPHISVNLCPERSTHPPKNPWVPPIRQPIRVPVMASETPNSMDILNP